MNDYEIIQFKNDSIELSVNVSPSEETIWLTIEQMATLFDRDRTFILKHVNNLYKDDELDVNSTCAKFAHIRIEGQREITRQINYYNLDVIIPVGYRVKSKNAIVFRKWANNVLKVSY